MKASLFALVLSLFVVSVHAAPAADQPSSQKEAVTVDCKDVQKAAPDLSKAQVKKVVKYLKTGKKLESTEEVAKVVGKKFVKKHADEAEALTKVAHTE